MIGLVFSSTGYAPAGRPTQSPTTPQRAAVSTNIRMNAAGCTETVDFTGGKIRPQRDVVDDQMRPRPDIEWLQLRERLENEFGIDDSDLKKYDEIPEDAVLAAYEMMQLCRQFENACNQAYMQGNIRGFMHLDNGQESIPAMLADFINKDDIKYSYYREHTHALASGIDPGAIMAELFAKDTGTCRGTGGSMHIYDVDTHFQGGWALVSEQLPYAAGAARSILLDRELGQAKDGDDRMTVVFCGEGGSQNGRMAETLNAAAKENLPLLFVVIDNGRAINTFTQDVAKNSDVYLQGQHYGVPASRSTAPTWSTSSRRAVPSPTTCATRARPSCRSTPTASWVTPRPTPSTSAGVRWRSAGRAPSVTRSSYSRRPISRPR